MGGILSNIIKTQLKQNRHVEPLDGHNQPFLSSRGRFCYLPGADDRRTATDPSRGVTCCTYFCSALLRRQCSAVCARHTPLKPPPPGCDVTRADFVCILVSPVFGRLRVRVRVGPCVWGRACGAVWGLPGGVRAGRVRAVWTRAYRIFGAFLVPPRVRAVRGRSKSCVPHPQKQLKKQSLKSFKRNPRL